MEVSRSRSQPLALLYSHAVRQLGLGCHGSGSATADLELGPAHSTVTILEGIRGLAGAV